MKIVIDTDELPDDDRDQLLEEYLNGIKIEIFGGGGGGIIVSHEAGWKNTHDIRLSFTDLIDAYIDFWNTNDPEWLDHNLRELHKGLTGAIEKINGEITEATE